MTAITALEAAVAALPGSLVRTEDLARAVESLAALEDHRCRLALGARIIARILAGVELLEGMMLEIKATCGLSLPADPPPDRGTPLLGAVPRGEHAKGRQLAERASRRSS